VSRFNHFNLAFKIAAINSDPVLSLAFCRFQSFLDGSNLGGSQLCQDSVTVPLQGIELP
jgi:hypothetical protein